MVAAVVAFAGVLRRRGVAGTPGRAQLAVEALAAVDSGRRDDVYWALRATLVSGPDELPVFDAAFAEFWEGAPPAAAPGDETAGDQEPDDEDPQRSPDAGRPDVADATGDDDGGDDMAEGGAASAVERLAVLDFRAYGEAELRAARQALASLDVVVPRRRSRRLRPAERGTHVDQRRTLQAAMRTDGHPVRRAWRRRVDVPRRLVFLVDVSGSMRAYARPLLLFCQAAGATHRGTEAFTFGTRLTRLTPYMRGSDPDAALARAARAVPDWAGGTRIGDALRAFNREWGRRGMAREAVVVIVSDGWERGDVSLLATELATLRRTCHRLVWVNPHAGDPGYRPVAAGMAAALPHVDLLLPGHNLRAVAGLARALASM